jgi:hypothetical protein
MGFAWLLEVGAKRKNAPEGSRERPFFLGREAMSERCEPPEHLRGVDGLVAALENIARLTENRMVVEDSGLLAMRIIPTAGATIARTALAAYRSQS